MWDKSLPAQWRREEAERKAQAAKEKKEAFQKFIKDRSKRR